MSKHLPAPAGYPTEVQRDGIRVSEFASDHPALVTHPKCCEHVDSETRMPVDRPDYKEGQKCWEP